MLLSSSLLRVTFSCWWPDRRFHSSQLSRQNSPETVFGEFRGEFFSVRVYEVYDYMRTFLRRDATRARYCYGKSVRPSVCLSVRPW